MDSSLEANGLYIVGYSPVWTPRMDGWGARRIEPSRPEELRKALEAENVANVPASRSF